MERTNLTEQEASIYHTLDMIGGDPCENCEDLKDQIENLEDLLKKVQHQRNELYMALSELYDVQNGPPLIQESLEYEKAMVNARKLLEYFRGLLGK